jgi:hypothetical protein
VAPIRTDGLAVNEIAGFADVALDRVRLLASLQPPANDSSSPEEPAAPPSTDNSTVLSAASASIGLYSTSGRGYWSTNGGSFEANMMQIACKAARGDYTNTTAVTALDNVIAETRARTSSSGRNIRWKIQRWGLHAALAIAKAHPTVRSNAKYGGTGSGSIHGGFLATIDGDKTRLPTLILGTNPWNAGGGTFNQRLSYATSGLLAAQWAGNGSEEAYARHWLNGYFDLYSIRLIFENLSTYQDLYDEEHAEMHEHLPAGDPLRVKLRQVMDVVARSHAASWVDGWQMAPASRDKQSLGTQIAPYLMLGGIGRYVPNHRNRGWMFALQGGFGGYVPPTEALQLAHHQGAVIAREYLEYDNPSSSSGHPFRFQRTVYKNRCHGMGTIWYPASMLSEDQFQGGNNSTNWHPRLFKIAINNNGWVEEAFVTHRGTGVQQVGGADMWSSHFEWRTQHRNVYTSVAHMTNGDNFLKGPLPHRDTDERDETLANWWLGRWGDTLLAIWAANGWTKANADIATRFSAADGLPRTTRDSIRMNGDGARKTATVWGLYHRTQFSSLAALRAHIEANARITWNPGNLTLTATMPVTRLAAITAVENADINSVYRGSRTVNGTAIPVVTSSSYNRYG